MKTDKAPIIIDPVGGDTSALESLGFERVHAPAPTEVGDGTSYDPLGR